MSLLNCYVLLGSEAVESQHKPEVTGELEQSDVSYRELSELILMQQKEAK